MRGLALGLAAAALSSMPAWAQSSSCVTDTAGNSVCNGYAAQKSVLPLSGGTMTGALGISGVSPTVISQSVVRLNSTTAAGNPALFVSDDNESSAYSPTYGSIYQGVPGIQVNRTNGPSANGSVNAFQANLFSQGNNPFASEDAGFDSHVYKSGQNSTWQFNGETDDSTGLPPGSFSAIGMESDILANGPDAPASLYDTSAANRRFIYLAPKLYPTSGWTAGAAIQKGALVQGTPSNGVTTIYVATSSGTTGSTQPTWPASGTVADGSVTWSYGEPLAMSVGTAIFLDNGETSSSSYNTGFGTNGIFQNAVVDISQAQLATGAAAIRLPPNGLMDLSAAGTAASHNQHLLGYSTYQSQNALIYNNPSGTVFSIADGNNLAKFAGPVWLDTAGNSAGVTTGYPGRGLVILWNFTNGGQETGLAVGQGGLNVYPTSSSGTISTPALTLSAAGALGVSSAVVGGATTTGTLAVSGSDTSAIAGKSAAFTYDATMHTIDASTATAAFAATLPACVTAISGRVYDLVKFDASTNAVTLTAATTNAQTGVADTISGAATVPLTTQWTAATVKCNGAGVWIRGASL